MISELLAAALPDCKRESCYLRVQRVEIVWHRDEDGRWRPVYWQVCQDGHRTRMEPFA